jgi:hypothetical protein
VRSAKFKNMPIVEEVMFHNRLLPNRLSRRSFLVLGLTAAGCSRQGHAPPESFDTSFDRSANHTARFLAGLKGGVGSPFAQLEQTAEWHEYARTMDASWARLDKGQLASVKAFQRRELSAVKQNNSFVFYPFSGPDVLYATSFFPDSKLYVLAGLEPVGHMRAPATYRKEKLDGELSGWNQALASILGRSFFVTSEMDRQFHGRVADGLLPMILLLLTRSGYDIEGFRYGHLSTVGEFVMEPPDATGKQKHMGVEIRFRRPSETVSRQMFYFSTDLGPAFQRDPDFSRFLTRLGKAETLVKSCSFLLHWGTCNAIRSHILKTSSLILEDDTGVPFRYLQSADWRVELFGEYSAPDRPFKKQYQHDLAAAFAEKTNVKTLGFSLGYGYNRRPSSMILARRAVS